MKLEYKGFLFISKNLLNCLITFIANHYINLINFYSKYTNFHKIIFHCLLNLISNNK